MSEKTATMEAPAPMKKSIITPFNIFAAIVIIVGIPLTYMRFVYGLDSVTNLDDNNPWGLWIGFDLLCGVALAAGGYVTSAAVYLFGLDKYHSAVRPAILTAFLGYFFFVIALLYDLGRPWQLYVPYFYSPGPTSVMFEVGLCVMLYLTVLFLEFSPAALEWLKLKKIRQLFKKPVIIVLTIFGVVLSTLHQSSLGAMFKLYETKLHPLWFSEYINWYFFVSSIAAGLSMVIFEGMLAHRTYRYQVTEAHDQEHNKLTIAFSKAASMVLAGYFTIKVIGVATGHHWGLLFTSYGVWFLVEMLGFVLLPCFLFAVAYRDKNLLLARVSAIITIIGIVINRLNISWIAFNWKLPVEDRYFPSWQELWISLFIVTLLVVAYRFIVSRMPILYEHPDYKDSH